MASLKPNKTQKEAFLFYLKRMDIEVLDIILTNEITYFGATKPVFLEKLSSIFNEYRLAGQKKHLTIKQKDSQSNTYYVYSNQYQKHFKQEYVIEEKDGFISNIFSNKKLYTYKGFPILTSLELFFSIDQRADFEPSIEYNFALYHCTNAIEEIANNDVQLLNYNRINKWLNKYILLYKAIEKATSLFAFYPFKRLYLNLKNVRTIMDYSKSYELNDALNEFDGFDDLKIKAWLQNHLNLFETIPRIYGSNFLVFDDNSENVSLKGYPNISFLKKSILKTKVFRDLYWKHYCPFTIIIENQLEFSF